MPQTKIFNLTISNNQDRAIFDLGISSQFYLIWRGPDGRNTLHEAVRRGWSRLVTAILDDEYVRSLVHGRDHKNETPLLTAFRHNKFEIVDLLIKKGAGGSSPILWALMERRIDFADFLINKKQYLNDSDENGVTALFYAVQMGDCQTVQTLLKMGAKPELGHWRNEKHITPLMLAVQMGEMSIVEVILSQSSLEGVKSALAVAKVVDPKSSLVLILAGKLARMDDIYPP
jgi:ankyrin repeat protein